MNTIDQRILIPTPPEVVWDYLGDLTKLPEWQADSKAVSFLTSKRNGPGTRLRLSGDKGQDRVVEITAWYDGLGYQYTFIDGVPYRESTGRIRLQEIPEGTVVQWTFTYEVGGLRLGLGRQIETAMETSLKSLWKQVSQSSGAQKIREAKSLMRDAPDYEARAQYKPRHAPTIDGKNEDGSPADIEQALPTQPIPSVPSSPYAPPQVEPVEATRGPIIDEPPVSEDDTRPRRPVTAAPAPMPDELFETTNEPDFLFRPPPTESSAAGLPDELFETTAEPDFLGEQARFAPPSSIVEPPVEEEDTRPRRPVTAGVAETPTPDEGQASTNDDLFSRLAVDEPIADEPPMSFVVPIDEPLRAPETAVIDQPEDLTVEPMQDATLPISPTEAQTQPVEPEWSRPIVTEQKPDITPTTKTRSREEISKLDTSTLSIWEIFGVDRPSDTPAAPPAPEPEPEPEPVQELAAVVPESPVDVNDETGKHEPVGAEIVDAVETPAVEIAAPETPEPVSAEVGAPPTPESVSTVVLAAPAAESTTPTVQSIRAYDLPPEYGSRRGSRRGGLRLRMRRKTVKLRFPE